MTIMCYTGTINGPGALDVFLATRGSPCILVLWVVAHHAPPPQRFKRGENHVIGCHDPSPEWQVLANLEENIHFLLVLHMLK